MVEGDLCDENLEFEWRKKRGVGGKNKEVQFYESFKFDGEEYTLYDTVYLYKEMEAEPFVGKLIKIWENRDKTKKVKVLWFFRPCEIRNFLGDEEVPANELFLASGDGVGLVNINPLESIAGKCNVVCISNDERNPQPSEEELHVAEFVFYRTFDVGLLKISDKINEKVAGVEAKFLLNNAGSHKLNGFARHNPITKEGENGAVPNVAMTDKSVTSANLTTNANLESPVVKDRSPRQISPRVTANLNGSTGKVDPALDEKLDVEEQMNRLNPALDEKLDVEEQMNRLKDLDDEERPLKKVKIDVSSNKLLSKNNGVVSTAKYDAKENASIGHAEKEIGPSSRKSHERSRLSNAKLVNSAIKSTLCDDDIFDYKTKEVTPRLNDNKNKWFTHCPWEERVADAQKRELLVHLRNLDPTYTSTEVEDIVWHGLKLLCTAKMIQRTAISGPDSGEAFVIFKTKEAAERALKKLHEGCLLLPNGRPLVGSIGDPSLLVQPSTFHGHLVFAASRHPMNREKEAVSTSHCSQSNTIEFEMAADWLLLQERWDRAWEILYKRQGEQLRKLKGSLKSK